jgi:hypothetical protein
MDFRVLVGGSKGTLSPTLQLTIWNAAGDPIEQVQSFAFQRLGLTVGEWYYLSVDNYSNSSAGTFSLRVSNVVTNDNQAKAVVLPHTKDWASADAAYSNVDALSSSGTENGYYNVWFKFQATTKDLDLRVAYGGVKGTNPNAYLILYNTDGVTMIRKGQYIQQTTLVPGQWYYVAVESYAATGTFTLRISNELDNDNAVYATELSHTTSWVSADAAYTNVDATGDQFNGEPYGGVHNVWFKFKATTPEVDMRLMTGGAKGTLVNPRISLWDATGKKISIDRLNALQSIALTPGAWYYISVDDNAGTPGTFTVSISNVMGYDMRAKAELLKNISSWASADAAYTLVGATGDAFDDSPWGGIYNVWFKFVATTTDINVNVLFGGSKGTAGQTLVKLFDATGVLLITGNNKITSTSLVPGSIYYFSVDTNGSDPGSYTLNVSDHIGYDMKGGAEVIQHASGWCTDNAYYSTVGATPDETNTSACGAFHNNVWFKFQATGPTITLKLSTGGDAGTLANPAIYLLDKTGAVLACNKTTANATAQITYSSLTKGEWYYFIADSYNGNMGTFTLCVDGGSGSEMNTLCKGIFCDGNGAMGINTSIIPEGFKLSVKGKIIAEGVKVDLQSKWPDFVFKSNYDLTELADLKKYIELHGHLPNIPSEEEVKKDGLDLAAMNALLLQKIEEMTIHLIRVEERVKALEAENKDLKK